MKRKFIILRIVLVILVIGFILISGKMKTIDKIITETEKISKLNNYYLKVVDESNNVIEIFYKDGDYIYTNLNNNVKRTIYVVNDEKLLIVDQNGSKTVTNLETEPAISEMPNADYYKTNNIFEKIKLALELKTEKLDGKNVYKISDKNVSTWVDKDTYMILQEDNGGIRKYELKPNTVEESNLVKPDITE